MGLTAMFNKGMELRNDVPVDNINSVVNYLTLRKAIGWLGLILPFALYFSDAITGQCKPQNSISHYYYTIGGDLFVGVLFAFSFILFSYKGLRKIENRITNIAGFFCLLIPFFPTASKGIISSSKPIQGFCLHAGYDQWPWVTVVHFSAAGTFFALLGLLSLFIFPLVEKTTKELEEIKLNRKPLRNKVYKSAGVIILLFSLIAFFVNKYQENLSLGCFKVFYLCEVILLIAFGVSWLTKGHQFPFLNDK